VNPELNVFTFVQGFFANALNGAMTQNIQAGLQFSRGFLHAFAAMAVLSTMIMALLNNMTLAGIVGRTLRILIVSQLIVNVDLYTRFVVTPVMTTFPNLIATTFGGSGVKTIPDQYSAVYNAISNISATLRTQASGLTYIPERINIYWADLLCKAGLVPQYALYFVLQLFMALAVLAGTLVIIFFMFKYTQRYAEAWVGTIVGGIVTLALISIVLQMVMQMNVSYIQQSNNLYTSGAGAGANISAGIETLINIFVIFFIGIVWIVMAFIIGIRIGGGAGISASAALQRFVRPV
jgi:hypothetical protein